MLSARQKFKFGEGKGPDQEVHESYLHVWVPEEVLGAGVYEVVPEWRRMPQMSYLEFYNGLQRRNWTNELYDPQAEPWRLAFYEVRWLSTAVPAGPCLDIEILRSHWWDSWNAM